ncbi:MAG: hypothetical protein ACFFDT_13120, partial [Candidatus Hodarchaeota archaeon]
NTSKLKRQKKHLTCQSGENMAKDKIYGYGIFFITIILLIVYTVWVPWQMLAPDFLIGSDMQAYDFDNPVVGLMVPTYLGVLLFGFIIAWIGLTMATTPPPEPIDLEELDLEDKPAEEE